MAFSSKQLEELRKPLDPARIVTKNFPGKGPLSYLEGYDAIDMANAIFGFDGWDSRVLDLREHAPGLWLATVEVRVTAGERVVTRQDVGTAIAAAKAGTTPSSDAQETASKGAVTDAVKRALRTFGNAFGLSLYDKTDPTGVATNSARQQQGEATTGQPATTAATARPATATSPASPAAAAAKSAPPAAPAEAPPVPAKPDSRALWNVLLDEAAKKGYEKEGMAEWAKQHIQAVFEKQSLAELTAQEWDALIHEVKQAPGAAETATR